MCIYKTKIQIHKTFLNHYNRMRRSLNNYQSTHYLLRISETGGSVFAKMWSFIHSINTNHSNSKSFLIILIECAVLSKTVCFCTFCRNSCTCLPKTDQHVSLSITIEWFEYRRQISVSKHKRTCTGNILWKFEHLKIKKKNIKI